MSPTQMMAWLICLVLAFFAAAIGVKTGYRVTMLEKEFATVRRVAAEQNEALDRLSAVLEKLDVHLNFSPAFDPRQADDEGGAAPAEGERPADRVAE